MNRMGKRTLFDKLISNVNSARYALAEKRKLKRARQGWEDEKNPLISVYIPTYNRPELLIDRGIKSVLNQTYENFELIVVDDGSDEWPSECMPFGKIDDRIVFYPLWPRKHPKNKMADWLLGPTRAANFALDICKGGWIARNDDDDIWAPDHLEKLLRFAQNNDYEMVYGATEQERYGVRYKSKFQEGLAPIGSLQASLYRSYLKCFKFNKHCWRKAEYANNDIDLPVRMRNAGVRIGYLDEVVTYILPRPGLETIGSEAIGLKRESKSIEV